MAPETTGTDRDGLDALEALRYATDVQLLGLVAVVVVGWWLTNLRFGTDPWPLTSVGPLYAIQRLLTSLANAVIWFVGATTALVGSAATLYKILVDARARARR